MESNGITPQSIKNGSGVWWDWINWGRQKKWDECFIENDGKKRTKFLFDKKKRVTKLREKKSNRARELIGSEIKDKKVILKLCNL